jgi:hypothetical protein
MNIYARVIGNTALRPENASMRVISAAAIWLGLWICGIAHQRIGVEVTQALAEAVSWIVLAVKLG